MPLEKVKLTCDNGTVEDVEVELELVEGGRGSMTVVGGLPDSPLRKTAALTIRPSGSVPVTISADSEQIAVAVREQLLNWSRKDHPPTIRIAPNLPPVKKST